jgi:phage gp16-like protein
MDTFEKARLMQAALETLAIQYEDERAHATAKKVRTAADHLGLDSSARLYDIMQRAKAEG